MYSQLVAALERCLTDPSAENQLVSSLSDLPKLDEMQMEQLLEELLNFAQNNSAASQSDQQWPRLLFPCINRLAANKSDDATLSSANICQRLRQLYTICPPREALRNQILGTLASMHNEIAYKVWCDLVCENPPLDRVTIPIAFTELLTPNRQLPAWFYEQLIAHATKHVSVAPAIFDLMNYGSRTHDLDSHPASSRVGELRGLLGNLVGQMSKIEEGTLPADVEPAKIAEIIGDSVALIVSLCDALAIMKDEQSIGKFHQAMGLKHRRIQTEAAAALMVLGDEAGKETLLKLAEHPVARLRVLAYARELDFENDISLEHRGDIALAESHLAMWLAEPTQMGVAPTKMHLVDNRELNWPSYEHPMQCYLFRFAYGDEETGYSNIGISGPLTHAFPADIKHLSVQDMYAAFAGWQTIHEEIFNVPIVRARDVLSAEAQKLERRLDEQDFSEATPIALTSFFGQYALVVQAVQDNESGFAIVDENGVDWIDATDTHESENTAEDRRIDWQLALDIWRGRKLLANFNPVTEF